MSKALFVDRDGTLIIDKNYLSCAEDVELLPGAGDALRLALDRGYRLFLFTNQSGVGRGYFTMADVEACNARMLELLDLPEPGFSGIGIAPERPDEPPVYRKPAPRFIHEMREAYGLDPAESWMVGDKRSDIEAGLNAGISSALLETWDLDASLRAYAAQHSVPIYPDLLSCVKAGLCP